MSSGSCSRLTSPSMIGFYVNGLNTTKIAAKTDRDNIRDTFKINVKLCYNHSFDAETIRERVYHRPFQTLLGWFCEKGEPCGLKAVYQNIQEAKKAVANSLRQKIREHLQVTHILIFAHSQGADIIHELFYRRTTSSLPRDKISIIAFGGMTLIPTAISSESSVSANLICKKDIVAKLAQTTTNYALGMKAFNIQILGQEVENEIFDCDGHGMSTHYLSSPTVIQRVRSLSNRSKRRQWRLFALKFLTSRSEQINTQ